MPSWTHLVRFVAKEDHQIHIGQLVDTTRDVGQDTIEGKEIKVYEINGTIFNGTITKTQLTVQQVRPSPQFPNKNQTHPLTSYPSSSPKLTAVTATSSTASVSTTATTPPKPRSPSQKRPSPSPSPALS
jgi:hypothetical protein